MKTIRIFNETPTTPEGEDLPPIRTGGGVPRV